MFGAPRAAAAPGAREPRHDLAQSAARHVGVSAEHLSRLLRRCLGLGFRQQLRDLRLDWATSQMAGWQQGLLQICLAAGFPDYRAFCAAFKERYGLTPRQYQSRL